MSDALVILNVAIEVAFSLLAVKTAVDWARQPDRRHGYLTLALGSLALLVLLSPALYGGGFAGQAATVLGIALFLLSGYGLLMFRNSFVPLDRRVRQVVVVAIVLAGLAGIIAQLPPSEAPHSLFQSAAVAALFAVWAYCIVEPTIAFWLSARGRPSVERGRMRAISVGYAGLLAVIAIGTVVGAAGDAVSLLIDIVALAIVPILYVAFSPPGWLRRVWRQPEEDQFRQALHDLLLYCPDRVTLGARALGWAQRLVGGNSEFIVDSDGSVLATRGIEAAEAAKIAAELGALKADADSDGRYVPWQHGSTLVVPLDLREGRGAMVILASGLSPLFGDDELDRLRQYAVSISAGLDRVALSERIAALERAKSDFLSIASHELRGPMTVIKGYLTMVESGALGDVSPKVQSVLPLLVSKSDEVNWLIEQMIEASRLEDGRLALKKRKTDIVELTDIAVDGVRMLLGNHNLHVEVPPDAIDADVDPDRFQIVVRNLLSNAAKYSPAGTDIDVQVRKDGTEAYVVVKDRGVGISKDDQRALFTRFARIENQSGHVQGTGLGLWLSREIARMHDGDLTVESEPGHGSTFTLTVPITN